MLLQSGELVRFAGRPPALRGGRDFTGPSALDRFYRVSDGWLRLQASDPAPLQAAGLLDPLATSSTDAELSAELGRTLAAKSLVEALACLAAVGIPAVAARHPADLPNDPALCELDMFATLHLEDGTPFYVTNRYARFSRSEEKAVFEAPGLGEHSRQVLAEAGLGSAEIDALVETGVVKQGQPFKVVALQNYR
jgi:crotonobetainyl-CoA:carnitine CoA-transferase CaiB-like acyl-CoA transferase